MRYKLSKEEEYLIICLKEGMKVGICKIPVVNMDYLYNYKAHNEYTDEGRIEYRTYESGFSNYKEISKETIKSLCNKKLIYKDWDSYHHIWYKLTEKGEYIKISFDKLELTDDLYKATKFGKIDNYILKEKPSKKQKLNDYIDILYKIKDNEKVDILYELSKNNEWSIRDFIDYILPKHYVELFNIKPIIEPESGNDCFKSCDNTFKELVILFCIKMLGIKNSDGKLKEIYEPKIVNESDRIYMPDPFMFNNQN